MNTKRQEIIELITDHPLDTRSISMILGISQKIIEENLFNIQKTYKKNFKIYPAICNKCDFEFTNNRFTKPGKCPRCKSTWIVAPRIGVVDIKCPS